MVLDHSCFVRKLFFIATTMKIRSKDWQHSHPGPKRKKEPQQPSCLYSTHLWKILRTCLWWWSKGSYQHWLLISTYKEKNTLFRKNKDNFTFEGFGGAQWYLQSLVELWFFMQCIHWQVFPKSRVKKMKVLYFSFRKRYGMKSEEVVFQVAQLIKLLSYHFHLFQMRNKIVLNLQT